MDIFILVSRHCIEHSDLCPHAGFDVTSTLQDPAPKTGHLWPFGCPSWRVHWRVKGSGGRSGLSGSCVPVYTAFIHGKWQHLMKREGMSCFVCIYVNKDPSHCVCRIYISGREPESSSGDPTGCPVHLNEGRCAVLDAAQARKGHFSLFSTHFSLFLTHFYRFSMRSMIASRAA